MPVITVVGAGTGVDERRPGRKLPSCRNTAQLRRPIIDGIPCRRRWPRCAASAAIMQTMSGRNQIRHGRDLEKAVGDRTR